MNQFYRDLKSAIRQEINCLVKLYPYNIRKFFDAKTLHASGIFAFYNAKKNFENSFLNKVVSLASGMELLSAGLKSHNFNGDDFMLLVKDMKFLQQKDKECEKRALIAGDKISENDREKDYTLGLLFGDIFYSRASVYILEYGDYELFNEILESLKSVHKNKLLLHQQLVKAIQRNKYLLSSSERNIMTGRADLKNIAIKNESQIKSEVINIIRENETLLTGVNDLLKTSFMTGWSIFCGFDSIDFPYSIINDFIMFKTFCYLEDFFKFLPDDFNFMKNLSFIHTKKKNLKERLEAGIGKMSPAFLKNNFRFLYRLYTKGN